jgi:hypothetical protein
MATNGALHAEHVRAHMTARESPSAEDGGVPAMAAAGVTGRGD